MRALASQLAVRSAVWTSSIGAEAIKRIKADVVEVEYQDGMLQTTVPSFFHSLLRGIGSYPSAFGHQFQRIIKV